MSRLLLFTALAVTLAACSSDDAADDVSNEPASIADAADAIEPMPPASGAPSAPSVSGATLVDRVAEAADLTTLRRLLRESGLADSLAAEGPFTLFAPTDEAFAAAGDLPTYPAAVRQLLLGHVLPFRIQTDGMDFEQSVGTLGGSQIAIAPGAPPAVSSGGARAQIARADLDASNGVVHVITTVLR